MPDNKDYVTNDLFNVSVEKLEAEDNRQNKRLSDIEDQLRGTNKIVVSVEKLAINMEHMIKEQQNQSVMIKDQSDRIKAIEDRDGEKWRNVTMYIITSIISLVIGYLACVLGLK